MQALRRLSLSVALPATLVLIPAVYTIMDDFQGLVARAPLGVRRVVRWAPARRPHVAEPEGPRTPERVPIPAAGAD